ncbi:MAG: atpH [Candidatus Saccharibacteria bacterium]|jgi:F0F1-type ATP synthase delta subunit|nr:atpH [Candidatus Saccharibacteria bacterium]
MAARLSRRKIAIFVTDKILASNHQAQQVLRELAAYLVTERRTRELDLIVRDIEAMLAAKGTVIADIASARPLDVAIRAEITAMLAAKSVQLRETIDETLLGGVRIDTPGKRFDGTIRHKLNALRAKQL